jgi:hypothetical protein
MATLVISADGGRIWKLGEALQRALGESPTQQSVSVTIDNTAFTVTLPSGKVISV